MKLLSINVAGPQQVSWNGQPVETSIFKKPVSGSVEVHKNNMQGDQQADLLAHGGEHRAVLIYQKESYDYWKDIYPVNLFHYGIFGENLTVEGLSDEEVFVGDRFQIGTAQFEVSQPRVTCYKAGISTGIAEMPRLMVSNRRPGFYCRVIQEGIITAGDKIIKIHEAVERLSVASISQLLYSNQHPTDLLKKAMAIPALSNGWRNSFYDLYESLKSGKDGNAGLSAPSEELAWEGFKRYTITAIKIETADVKSFKLQLSDHSEMPSFKPGQHLAVKIVLSTGEPQIRMYSLCNAPGSPDYQIAVKKIPSGIVSSYFHENVAVGTEILATAPRGDFLLTNDNNPVVLMSAGIGITPLLPMLFQAALSKRITYWIHSARNQDSYPFFDHIGTFLTGRHHVRSYAYFSQIQNAISAGYGVSSRLTLDQISSLKLPVEANYYLCGPSGYLQAISRDLIQSGVPKTRIHEESFGGYRQTEDDNTSSNESIDYTINLIKSKVSILWKAHYKSILEALEEKQVAVNWSCRMGVCHRCETALPEGDIAYTLPPLDYPAKGRILVCCAMPLSTIQLDL